MLFTGCRAERSDAFGDAKLRERDDIHIAFHDHDARAFALPRELQAVQFVTLAKQRGFRGIEVLRLASADYSAAKGNCPAAAINDRKDQALTKFAERAACAGGNQPSNFQSFEPLLAVAQCADQCVLQFRSLHL